LKLNASFRPRRNLSAGSIFPMPTVKIHGFRFFFYSNEAGDPPHVHVARAGEEAEFGLGLVEPIVNDGFTTHELSNIKQLILVHEDAIAKAWYEYFS